MALTHERFKKAADIIDAKKFSFSNNDDEDTEWAGCFIFDKGIFYLGEAGMAAVKKALLDKYEEEKARAASLHP
ncbi:hypothetical protein EVC24_151 [Rhizobium phage RHph_I4]|nr:hypothetical protein EVC24_151 [Rhizobium phage RHph_I4]